MESVPVRLALVEVGEVGAERGERVDRAAHLRRARQALQVAADVAAGDLHAVLLAPLLDVGDEMLATEREALPGRGPGDALTAIEPGARLAKDPGVVDRRTADHHARTAGLPQRALRGVGAVDVAVDDDGHAHDLA